MREYRRDRPLIAIPTAPGECAQLIKFDFRNGPLRKKYDSVKYAVRRLETLLYELSLTRATEVGAADAPAAAGDDRGGDE